MNPYFHSIPYDDQYIIYLNGSMKCGLVKNKVYMSNIDQLTEHSYKLFIENETLFHKQKNLVLGPVGLTLNVANKCNLNCAYCYANGGVYSSSENLMNVQTAVDAVKLFAEYYHELKRIKFFGGEPFLNPDAIEATCEICKSLVKQNILRYMPDFDTVTNGTLLNQKLIDLIKTYNIAVTVRDRKSVV